MQYKQPIGVHRTITHVSNSKFVCTTSKVTTQTEVKDALSQTRTEMPDASHHVYAFRVGFGNTVMEGMTDAGEPSGTAGPPILAVIRGSDVGDILVVVSRYFGGTKLGTGGLVRAYSGAARENLVTLPTAYKISQKTLRIDSPYPFYETLKRLLADYHGAIEENIFAATVKIIALVPEDVVHKFCDEVGELSSGRVSTTLLD